MAYIKHSILVSTSKPRKDGAMSVIYRVSLRGKQDSIYSGISILDKHWSKKTKKIKQGSIVNGTPYNILNSTIDEHISFIHEYFNNCSLRNMNATLPELKSRFNSKYKLSDSEQSDEFYYLFEEFIKTKRNSCNWKPNMAEKYNRIKNRLKERHPNLTFADLSENMMNKILKEWAETMYNDAILSTLSCFRRFITWVQQKNYPINNEFFIFAPKLKTAEKQIRYLTIAEQATIRNLNLPKDSALFRVRDMFLFQCGTGLRYSDMKKLRKEEITLNEKGRYVLSTITQKDKGKIAFPLCKIAEEIYLRYKDNNYEGGVLLPVISNQKYNEHLKELGKLANLQGEWIDYEYRLNEEIIIRTPKQNLESHTARRTFITTAYEEGVELDLIALLTSHSDVSAMKPYFTIGEKGATKVVDAIDVATTGNAKTD